MNKSIVFYGERGLVNSIIFDMKDDLARQKNFLRCIRLESKFAGNNSCESDRLDNDFDSEGLDSHSCEGDRLDWIDELESMSFFVEPSFSEFGSPDLIIKAKCSDDKEHVIFLEAKTDTYRACAVELASDGLPVGHPMECYHGIGSKVNVQLGYKYRFVEALKLALMTPDVYAIVEKNKRERYHDKNRRLLKENLVKFCFEFFKDVEDFYFVALTNEDIDNKGNEGINGKLLDPIPCIGDANWKKDYHKFGLCTYQDLERNNVVSRSFGYYAKSASLMLE